MKVFFVFIVAIVFTGLVIWGVRSSSDTVTSIPYVRKTTSTSPQSSAPDRYRDRIRVEAPKANSRITSPLTFSGEARGVWFFEATFPVQLLDENGNRIASGHAQAQEEWMTEDFVSFTGSLEFVAPQTAMGTLVFEKDNPSGLPEHADEFRVPVRFR